MIWIAAVFFPLVLAAVCMLPGACLRAGFRMIFLAPLPALLLAFTTQGTAEFELTFFLLESRLGFGPHGKTFLLITSLSWLFASLFTALGPRGSLGKRSFCVMFLLTMCGNLGLVLSRDAVSFYTFFALMTFCAYSLIVHSKKDSAYTAGRIYLIMAVLGEGMLMAGIITSVFLSPSHYFDQISPALGSLSPGHPVFIFLFAGFGVKAGLIFLHFWLPLAHPAAPTPASAVLSAAMIKAGILGWMNFFPLGLVPFASWASVLMTLGLGGAFFGAMAGLGEREPKIILAYSSISQMGLMVFCLGLGFLDQNLWIMAGPVLFLLVFNHALSKTALFLGIEVMYSVSVSRGKKTWTAMLMAVPALALAGAPFTGGSQAKYLLKEVLGAAALSGFFSWVISISSGLTALLMIHFIRQAASAKKHYPCYAGRNMTWICLVVIILILPWIFYELYPRNRIQWMDPLLFTSSLWPVLAGLAAYVILRHKVYPATREIFGVLPGSAEIIDRTWHHLKHRLKTRGVMESLSARMNLVRFSDNFVQSKMVQKISHELERWFRSWSVSVFLFILMIITIALMAWTGA